MNTLNWVLGIVSLVTWGGAIAWYFKDEIKTRLLYRNDKWFRGE